MFRDLFSFAVGAIVALASVMPYEKCMKSLKDNLDSAYTFITRMDRLAQIEVRTGLDVDWIEATRAWTGLQKECARTAAETCHKMGGAGVNKVKKSVDENNCKPLAKVAKQFERNPDLGMDPYNLTKTYLDNRDQIDKKALDSVMEARNAVRTMNELVEVSEFRSIPGSLNPRPLPIPIPKMVVVDRLNQSTEQLASDFEHRADLVATPDVVERPAPALERLLDEVACELDANPNASIQKNEHGVVSSEAVARSSEE